ncbi:MAG: hypothetical protein KGR26_02670 [Cyanobacteria bacterium REEB65]|nr:hypothetical protein [Cyanobacteria bacterium REEB65]
MPLRVSSPLQVPPSAGGKRRAATRQGQALVEYGVLVAAIFIGLVMAAKGVQLALSHSLQSQHQALANSP